MTCLIFRALSTAYFQNTQRFGDGIRLGLHTDIRDKDPSILSRQKVFVSAGVVKILYDLKIINIFLCRKYPNSIVRSATPRPT